MSIVIDDLLQLEAPEGTYQVDVYFHMSTEADVMREAYRRGKSEFVTYLPDETNRRHVYFNDSDSGVAKTFISVADQPDEFTRIAKRAAESFRSDVDPS